MTFKNTRLQLSDRWDQSPDPYHKKKEKNSSYSLEKIIANIQDSPQIQMLLGDYVVLFFTF